MNGWRHFAAFFLAMFLLCSAGSQPALQCPNTLRVAVMRSGAILLDGVKGTKEDLERHLRALDKTNGTVWYYREGAEDSPSEKQDASIKVVLDLVTRHGRPISFSSKPDFSDVVDGDGRLLPRTAC